MNNQRCSSAERVPLSTSELPIVGELLRTLPTATDVCRPCSTRQLILRNSEILALAQSPSWRPANSTSYYWRMYHVLPTAKFILEIFSLYYLCLSRYATVCLYFRPSVVPTMGVGWCLESLPFSWMKLSRKTVCFSSVSFNGPLIEKRVHFIGILCLPFITGAVYHSWNVCHECLLVFFLYKNLFSISWLNLLY